MTILRKAKCNIKSGFYNGRGEKMPVRGPTGELLSRLEMEIDPKML